MSLSLALTLVLSLSAEELLERSIAYHDPEGRFFTAAYEITLSESRPDGTERRTIIVLDNARGAFHMNRAVPGEPEIELEVRGDEVAARLDGSETFDDASAREHRLTPEMARRTRDYYLFLYGLPMKLREPGTRLGPEARETRFAGTLVHELEVTYDASVGSDTWYFYLDRGTSALVGYRFHHDVAANDGEYIVLSEESEGAGLRLPRVRKWYRNGDDGYLGTDTIVELTPSSK